MSEHVSNTKVVCLTSDLRLHCRRSLWSAVETSSTGSMQIRPLAAWAPSTRWGEPPSGSSATDIFFDLAHHSGLQTHSLKTKQNCSCSFLWIHWDSQEPRFYIFACFLLSSFSNFVDFFLSLWKLSWLLLSIYTCFHRNCLICVYEKLL